METFRRNMSPPFSGPKNKPRNQHETDSKQSFNRLHGVIFQKAQLFIITAVITAYPTSLLVLVCYLLLWRSM
jgi:hypothetical protein